MEGKIYVTHWRGRLEEGRLQQVAADGMQNIEDKTGGLYVEEKRER